MTSGPSMPSCLGIRSIPGWYRHLTDELKKAKAGDYTLPCLTAIAAAIFVEASMTKWVEHENGICWEESTLLAEAGLRHGVTGRMAASVKRPFSRLTWAFVDDRTQDVLENRRRLMAVLNCDLPQLTTARQTHMKTIIAVGQTEIGRGAGSYADAFPHTDALMTNLPGVPLMMCVADCVPVILFDPVKSVCAVVRWLAGTAQRLAAKTVLLAMQLAYGSKPKISWLISARLFQRLILKSVKIRL